MLETLARKPRLRRLFRANGRTLIVAMDHLSKPGRGVQCHEPGKVMREISAAGADAVLLRHGVAARHAGALGNMGLILSLGREVPAHEYGVELALRLGADAVKVEVFPGAEDAARAWAHLGPLAARCEQWGMPLLAETLPVSFEAKDSHTPGNLMDAARMGADLGADIIKTKYTGDAASFASLLSLTEAPVLVLGGAGGDERSLLEMVRAALDAGAVGAAIGRRVWGSARPGAMAGALARLIHEDASVEDALSEVSRVVSGPLGNQGAGRRGDG